MPEKVTWEEKIIELAIRKAKDVLQETEHLGQLELDDPLTGEEIKVKKPKKNPSEETLPKTSNVEGKEDKLNEVTKAAVLAAIESILKEFEHSGYGEKFSNLNASGESNPFLQQEMNEEQHRAYEEAMKTVQGGYADIKQNKVGAVQEVYEAVRVLMELDKGLSANVRSTFKPPQHNS